jgi:hypothetical protein
MPEEELFAVVCTELHTCVGPFPKKAAHAVAVEMTGDGHGCVYVPVPMNFMGMAVRADNPEEFAELIERVQGGHDREDEDHRRGYL